jgi:hypothetical protein
MHTLVFGGSITGINSMKQTRYFSCLLSMELIFVYNADGGNIMGVFQALE